MTYDITKETSSYTRWLLALIALICEQTGFDPKQLALTDSELAHYFENGKSPNNVFYDIWLQDAGNYFGM